MTDPKGISWVGPLPKTTADLTEERHIKKYAWQRRCRCDFCDQLGHKTGNCSWFKHLHRTIKTEANGPFRHSMLHQLELLMGDALEETMTQAKETSI